MSWKAKEDTRKFLGLKETKETGQLDPTDHLGVSFPLVDTRQLKKSELRFIDEILTLN